MIKAECQDPYIAKVNWQASNFPWCTGYAPRHHKQGIDLPFYKRSNGNRITTLRPILLFGIECNMHNKQLGREAMKRAEIMHGVTPEQFGSRRKKSADLQALNTRLFYDYTLLKKHPGTSLYIDLVSNYDLVVHSIATLAIRWVGMPPAPIFCSFNTIQDM
eukprot:4910695-Ditylum_brightwellii.AAC.1